MSFRGRETLGDVKLRFLVEVVAEFVGKVGVGVRAVEE
jgi:hypothetical protein